MTEVAKVFCLSYSSVTKELLVNVIRLGLETGNVSVDLKLTRVAYCGFHLGCSLIFNFSCGLISSCFINLMDVWTLAPIKHNYYCTSF